MIRVSLGDLVDRFTINVRKKRYQDASVSDEEVDVLAKCIVEDLNALSDEDKKTFIFNLCELCDYNYEIWHREFDIRTAEQTDLDDNETGKKSKAIRPFNTKRAEIRNKINKYSKTGFVTINV